MLSNLLLSQTKIDHQWQLLLHLKSVLSMNIAVKFAWQIARNSRNSSSMGRTSPMCTVASNTIHLTFVDVDVRIRSLTN